MKIMMIKIKSLINNNNNKEYTIDNINDKNNLKNKNINEDDLIGNKNNLDKYNKEKEYWW